MSTLTSETVGDCHAAVFAALGDDTRLSLFETLSDGSPRSISRLAGGSHLTRQAITMHLKVLEGAGLLRSKRIGRETQFALRPEAIMDLSAYLDRVSRQWDDALGRLKTFVES